MNSRGVSRLRMLWILCLVFVAGLVRGDACVGHGGYIRCSSSGFSVCEDGTLDKRSPCSRQKSRERKLRFKKRPDRGQVLKPGETPPDTTLKDSYRELKNQ